MTKPRRQRPGGARRSRRCRTGRRASGGSARRGRARRAVRGRRASRRVIESHFQFCSGASTHRLVVTAGTTTRTGRSAFPSPRSSRYRATSSAKLPRAETPSSDISWTCRRHQSRMRRDASSSLSTCTAFTSVEIDRPYVSAARTERSSPESATTTEGGSTAGEARGDAWRRPRSLPIHDAHRRAGRRHPVDR